MVYVRRCNYGDRCVGAGGQGDKVTECDDLVIVETTVTGKVEADRLTEALVGERLAACVQCAPLHSVYRWQGAVEAADEYRLSAKTTIACRDRLVERIGELHRYELPEILVLPVLGGSHAYCEWVRNQVG